MKIFEPSVSQGLVVISYARFKYKEDADFA